MSKRFWTADWHLNSEGSIGYFGRPFKSAEQMNKRIIDNANQRVREDDTLIHVGDFCIRGSEKGLPGLKIKPAIHMMFGIAKVKAFCTAKVFFSPFFSTCKRILVNR